MHEGARDPLPDAWCGAVRCIKAIGDLSCMNGMPNFLWLLHALLCYYDYYPKVFGGCTTILVYYYITMTDNVNSFTMKLCVVYALQLHLHSKIHFYATLLVILLYNSPSYTTLHQMNHISCHSPLNKIASSSPWHHTSHSHTSHQLFPTLGFI